MKTSTRRLGNNRVIGFWAIVLSVVMVSALWAVKTNAQGICGAVIALKDCTRDAQNNIRIGAKNGCGASVYVDKSYMGAAGFNTITIDLDGTLCFPDQSVQLDVRTIQVMGLLQIGKKTHPIGTNSPSTLVTLNFTGSRPCAAGMNCGGFSKGIQVNGGGKLQMYGLKGVPPKGLNWTYLAQPAGPPDKYGSAKGVTAPVGTDGAVMLHVADDVTTGSGAWRDGDWIAVGGTSFSPFDTEIVKIVSVKKTPKGSDISISLTPLKHYHFGSMAPTPSQLCTVNNVLKNVACGTVPGCTSACTSEPSLLNYNDPAAQNYGVDERAPVALLSRNIKLTATVSNDPANLHWGGETRFLEDYKEVSIQGVELQQFGKDQLASYPLHFHMDGNIQSAATLIDSNSIHHSYNKCITVHSTQNLRVSNTVCVRAVGHLFYQEIGDETDTTFAHNLGIGAMSHSFDINKTDKFSRDDLIQKYWWTGDYMTNGAGPDPKIAYDGFNIPDRDATDNPVHGSCAAINSAGQLYGYQAPPKNGALCPPPPPPPPDNKPRPYYIEPASGFWIINPTAILTDNIIDGCQGVGVGYWYVPAAIQSADSPYSRVNNNQFLPVGKFRNNRVNGCFDGLFGEQAYSEASSALLHPLVGGTPAGRNLLAEFDGLTATRNRDRGVWMRDQWFVVNNGRFATNRDSASLLTAGGADGATPGDWMLFENSVLEGMSQNNVDRFGPCPLPDTTFSGQQLLQGCIDLTPSGASPHSGDEIGKGYPDPNWNTFGYMIYDGPARLYHDRFVNFKIKPALTVADASALEAWAKTHKLQDEKGNSVSWVYEGDAALGWFQSNQSSYPTLTNSKDLSFVNTDLRHQIYTQLVNLGKNPGNPASGFGDGDKNTAIIDLDGTLAGFIALDAGNNPSKLFDDHHPVSLNNLMINASSNSVDECLSQGGQDAVLEERPTSLISPSSMASLEFQMIYPPQSPTQTKPLPLQKQNVTFTKDSTDFDKHQTMTLSSRNALGVWEPKVTSGLGYTVTAAVDKANGGTKAGIPSVVDVGLLDAAKPKISPGNPFYVRLGICYTSADGSHPKSASSFTITQGYHSYAGGVIGNSNVDLQLRPYYNKLSEMYTANDKKQICDNLDGVNQRGNVPINLEPDAGFSGCPANGITLASSGCPSPGTIATDNYGQQVCVYPTHTLTEAKSISELTNLNGTYKSLDKYYYDSKSGWLFFYVAQKDANAIGPSPLGNCGPDAKTKDPSCPNNAVNESYYVCPSKGCTDYIVRLNDSTYKPAASTCTNPYPVYGLPEPSQPFHLAYVGGTMEVERQEAGANSDFPHYIAKVPPVCKLTTP